MEEVSAPFAGSVKLLVVITGGQGIPTASKIGTLHVALIAIQLAVL